MSYIYYHNPRCSKSRQGLELLKAEGLVMTIKDYLKEGLATEELDQLFRALNKEPWEVVRTKEKLYKDFNLADLDHDRATWLKTIAENPILLERPILTNGRNAVIGRPPEDLLKIL